MKRFLLTFLIFALLGFLFLEFVYKDQFDLIGYLKNRLQGSATVATEPAVSYVRDSGTATKITNPAVPQWRGKPDQGRWLRKVFEIGPSDFQFRNATQVEFGPTGNLYVLDFGNKTVEVFDRGGAHQNKIGYAPNGEVLLFEPEDFAVSEKGTLYIADRRKGVMVFSRSGDLLQSLPFSVPVEAIALDSNGDMLLSMPSSSYLLHKVLPDGTEVMAFAEQQEHDRTSRTVFSQVRLAIDERDNIYASFLYPYRIVKFDQKGKAVAEFAREMEEPVNPPTIYRDDEGAITQVIRQQISYDIEVGSDGLVYNLIRTKGVRGGDILDVFSPKGDFLQSFYLAENALSFALRRNRIALLGSASSRQSVRVYEIESVQ